MASSAAAVAPNSARLLALLSWATAAVTAPKGLLLLLLLPKGIDRGLLPEKRILPTALLLSPPPVPQPQSPVLLLPPPLLLRPPFAQPGVDRMLGPTKEEEEDKAN
jgi:hypothetical protein